MRKKLNGLNQLAAFFMQCNKLLLLRLMWAFSWITKVYLKPVIIGRYARRYPLVSIFSDPKPLILAMLLGLAYFFAPYYDTPSVPAFSQLNVSEGILDFKPTRYGAEVVITQKNNVLTITCQGGSHYYSKDCIKTKKEENALRGRSAKVWWTPHTTKLGVSHKLLQLQVEEKIIIFYAQQKKIYETPPYSHSLLNFCLFLFFLTLYLIGMPSFYYSKYKNMTEFYK